MTEQEMNQLYRVIINGYAFDIFEISDLSNVNVRSYKVEPKRSAVFSMPTIRQQMSKKIPRFRVSFKNATIETYRRICQAIDANEFPVEYYDFETGRRVNYLMYATPQELDSFYGYTFDELRTTGKTLNLNATMNEFQEVTIIFDANGGTFVGGGNVITRIVPNGSAISIPTQVNTPTAGCVTHPEGKFLLRWTATFTGGPPVATPGNPILFYPPGSTVTAVAHITYYAQWGG